MPLIGEYLTPVYFFVVVLGLAAGIVVRRLWRTGAGSRDLDRAQFEGRLSEDLRRRWDRQKLYFVLQVIFAIGISAWIFYALDDLLQP
jgi:hypothetical protein